MYVLGIDLGFSETQKTSCYCGLKIDRESKMIEFLFRPQKFNYHDPEFFALLRAYPFEIITLDAPLTPKHIYEREQAIPKTGRKLEKAFSLDIFHGARRGPQPSSIAVPKQGWPFYCAGMRFVSEMKPYRYLSLDDIRNGSTVGIYETIPKLVQALLIPREVLVSRTDQIDNYLFPRLFQKSSDYRCFLDNMLDGFSFSSEIENYINNISRNIRLYHEELAAIVCAVQAFFIYTGNASFVGFDGDYEAYYALPNTAYWQEEWRDCFTKKTRNRYQDIRIFERELIPKVKKTYVMMKPEKRTEIIKKQGFQKSVQQSASSTKMGYINKNNQKNLGKTKLKGSGNQQFFYQMQCLHCGHEYLANGHDIWLRKCPNCQGGRP